MALLWINDLSGSVNQYAAPDLLQNNQSPLFANISQSQIGDWAKRLGAKLLGTRISSTDPVRGLHTYVTGTNLKILHAVVLGSIYQYDATTNQWFMQQNQGGTGLSTTSDVNFTNFLGRHYFVGSGAGEYLSYILDSGNAVTVSGNIEGKYLATNQARLMISGGTTNPRRSYWTIFDSTGFPSDTFDTSAAYIDTNTPPTGVASYGNNRPFVIFTDTDYVEVDPNTGRTNPVSGFGCSSHRSIANVRGTLIWFGRDGFYMLAYNQAFPIEISLPIKNDFSGDAIINKIDSNNYTVIAAGASGNKYYCALRSLTGTVKGESLPYCVVEYDYVQQNWSVHTYEVPQLASVFAEYIKPDGSKIMTAGSYVDGGVYQLDYPGIYQDESDPESYTDVTTFAQTKHYEFYDNNRGAVTYKNIKKVHFRYYSEGTITVKYAMDGATTYSPLCTIPAYTDTQWTWRFKTFGKEARSISLRFECTSGFVLHAFGFEVEDTGNERTVSLT